MIALLLLVVQIESSNAQTKLTMTEALGLNEASDPRLRRDRAREDAGQERRRAELGSYWPTVSAAAIAAKGEPGAFSMMGANGNYGASQRSGVGGALILKQDVWDFGRTAGAVREAEARTAVAQTQTRVTRLESNREVLEAYTQCAYLKGRVAQGREIAEMAQLLARETDRFVRSGQRSVIERYLVETEARAAETRVAEFGERVKVTEERLSLLTGRSHATCDEIAALEPEITNLEARSGVSPITKIQEQRVRMAEAGLDRARAMLRPDLSVMATGGYFDHEHLATKWNYAVGIGLSVPIFDGFKTSGLLGEQRAQFKGEEYALEATRQALATANSKYDEQIRSLKLRLDSLGPEIKLAHETLKLSRKRYLDLQGSMVDLRESIKNLTRVLEESITSTRDYLVARGLRALLNGGRD